MKASKLFKTISVLGVASALVFTLSACTPPQEEEESPQIEGLTGGVAATVNGVEIEEDTITTYVQNYRTGQNMLEQDAWGQYLVDNELTPEGLREEVIESYIKQELIRQAAAENNIEVKSSEIDEYVSKMRDYYDSDEEWQAALEGAGTTEEKYREDIELALFDQAIRNDVIVVEDPTDEEMLESAQMYATGFDGAKKSSHILFDINDTAKAQEVLDQINAGELDFADAAKKHSTDTTTSSEGGNRGWDALATVTEEEKKALETLEVDQVSGLVTSDYGIHLIKVTDVFVAPEEVTDISQLPEEFIEAIKSNLESTKQSEAYDTWYEEYKESGDIKINDMPEAVPYNVDLSQYKKAGDETEADSAASDDANAEGTEVDGAAGEEADAENPDDTADTNDTEGAENTSDEDSASDSNQPSEVS